MPPRCQCLHAHMPGAGGYFKLMLKYLALGVFALAMWSRVSCSWPSACRPERGSRSRA